MGGGSLPKFSQLTLGLYRSAHELPVDAFKDGALEAVKALLPFDAALWGAGMLGAEGIDLYGVHSHRLPAAMLERLKQAARDDRAALRAMLGRTGTTGWSTMHHEPRGEAGTLRRFAQDHALRHCIVSCHVDPVTQSAQWLVLLRRDAAHPSPDGEVEMLAEVAPHLLQARAMNCVAHMERMLGDPQRERWSAAVADAQGLLYHADAQFRQLVQRQWPLLEGRRLPPHLMTMLLRANQQQLVGSDVFMRWSVQQGLVFLKARRRHEIDTLTEREFTIAQLLAAGLTRKQIAKRFARSPETVHTQVKAIFGKLGIGNVALLAPLLALRQDAPQ